MLSRELKIHNMEIEKGFYYNYKHDLAGSVNNHAYEVIGIGHHTEIDGLEASSCVIYRPLYDTAPVYTAGKHYDIKPYSMFIEDALKDGKIIPRFTKITDEKIIDELGKIRDKMYL